VRNRLRWSLFLGFSSWFLLAEEPEIRTLVFQVEHRFERKRNRDYMQLRLALPVTEPGRQLIRAIRFDPEPDRQKHEKGKRVAEWKWKDYARTKTIRVEVAADLIPPTHPQDPDELPGLTPAQIRTYLKSEPFVESDAEEIQRLAAEIPESDDLEEWIQLIADKVVSHLRYDGFNPQDLGALEAVKTQKGDCTEYADLFTALCRAKGLPARSRLCFLTRSVDTPLHSVSEVYLPGKGWRVVDPLWGEITGRKQTQLLNRYLFLSTSRNDTDMFGSFADRAMQKFGTEVTETVESTLRVRERKPDGSIQTHESTY